MVLGTTLGRPQTNAWTLGRVHNIINKGDGRFLAKIHVAVDGKERIAGQIKSPPEFSVLTYDNTSRSLLWREWNVQLAKYCANDMSGLAEPQPQHDLVADPFGAIQRLQALG